MDSIINEDRGSRPRTDPPRATGGGIYGCTALDATAPTNVGIQSTPLNAACTPRRERLLFIVNVAWAFRSHRLPLGLAAVAAGYEVHLASAFKDAAEQAEFERLNIVTHPVPLERSGAGIFSELRTIHCLQKIIRQVQPSLCHNVSIKPVIYGGILARLASIPTVSAVSGLGYSYIAQGVRAELRRRALSFAYGVAVNGRRARVILQNPDDYAMFKDGLGIAKAKLLLIRGSGVDPADFDPSVAPTVPPLVVLPARMLIDKGVGEFVAAARTLLREGILARFALVGRIDLENPAGLTQADIDRFTAEGVVEYWGHRSDIPHVMASAQIVCLPSYREGVPKALLEAAAAGRAIVATDVPGCREIVRHGENGLLVPPRDPDALAHALRELLSDADRCHTMGMCGRALVEEHFSVDMVVRRTLQLYEELLR